MRLKEIDMGTQSEVDGVAPVIKPETDWIDSTETFIGRPIVSKPIIVDDVDFGV